MVNDALSTTALCVVETAVGRLRGRSEGGICAFKGIPYGAPTGGANRFLPPQPVPPWAGVRDALDYRGQAPQWRSAARNRPALQDLIGPPDASPTTEDCLSLNLWTPELGEGGRRPVMVWLHGGAFAFHSANRPLYDGTNLARRGDVVVVGINHRLNIFGFLDLGEVGGERYARSGNAGMLDLVAALEWVRNNVERFGGDRGNVTIFGESGGGGKVSALLAMPAAQGLFHRAVIQSGAAIRFSTRERAAALAAAALKELGVGAASINRLCEMPAERLIAAIGPARTAVGPPPLPLLDRYDFGPVVDGEVVAQQPCDPGPSPLFDNVPVLIGNTKDESALYVMDDDAVWNDALSEAGLRAAVEKIAGKATDEVLDLYRTRDPYASPARRLVAALSAGQFWIRSVMWAERKARRGQAPVFMYSLGWETPLYGGRLGAPHTIDLPFVFDNTEVASATAGVPGARELAALVSASWAAFARSGNPQTAALPDWPGYAPAERATMVLAAECRLARDPDHDARLLWERVATRS